MTRKDISDQVAGTPFDRCAALERGIRGARDALCGDRAFLVSFVVFDMVIASAARQAKAEADASWIDNDFWTRP